MAIKNTDGNYLKVDFDRCRGRSIGYELYKEEDIRRNGPEKFDNVIQESHEAGSIWDEELLKIADDVSIKENLIRAAYRALKRDAKFEKWIDC